MTFVLIPFIPRWFGRSQDDGVNSEGGLYGMGALDGKHLSWKNKICYNLGWSIES